MADKRTLITKTAVKEAMLELLSQTPFNYITVSSLCREAGVGRATFYTHYSGLTDVIDELADDAIQVSPRTNFFFSLGSLFTAMLITMAAISAAPMAIK